jgi:uncharacterized protein
MVLYLDTSTLVKLYVAEEDSGRIAALVGSAEVVATSVIAYVETRSAFARRFREKAFTPMEYKKLVSVFQVDWKRYLQIAINFELIRLAGDLTERHALKGYDALHLAAAMTLRNNVAAPIIFSTADDGLRKAAEKENFLAKN